MRVFKIFRPNDHSAQRKKEHFYCLFDAAVLSLCTRVKLLIALYGNEEGFCTLLQLFNVAARPFNRLQENKIALAKNSEKSTRKEKIIIGYNYDRGGAKTISTDLMYQLI